LNATDLKERREVETAYKKDKNRYGEAIDELAFRTSDMWRL